MFLKCTLELKETRNYADKGSIMKQGDNFLIAQYRSSWATAYCVYIKYKEEVIVSNDPELDIARPSSLFLIKVVRQLNEGDPITEVMVECEQEWAKVSFSLDIKTTAKINPKDNTVAIKRVKDSWNREEVERLTYEAYKVGIQQGIGPSPKPFTEWISEHIL